MTYQITLNSTVKFADDTSLFHKVFDKHVSDAILSKVLELVV